MNRCIKIVITELTEIPAELKEQLAANPLPPNCTGHGTRVTFEAEGFTVENMKQTPVGIYIVCNRFFRADGVPHEVGGRYIADAIIACCKKACDADADARDEAKVEEVLKQSMGG